MKYIAIGVLIAVVVLFLLCIRYVWLEMHIWNEQHRKWFDYTHENENADEHPAD